MSLDYDLTKTSLRDEAGRIEWTGATEAIIFYTMSTGIGNLSEKNAPEFFARMQLLETLSRTPQGGRLSAADIKQHVGLTTNVFPQETRTQWLKRITAWDFDKSIRDYAEDADDAASARAKLPTRDDANTVTEVDA